MSRLAQFDYVFAIAMMFAFLDAWNIGANDVANSFASSISSRSLKYWQAMILAGICEFLGAVLAGSRVSDTIRNKIIDVELFEDSPAVLMLTMTCALVGSSTWLSIATSIGMPVSTTHSIVGGVIGAGIAAKGGNSIQWGWGGVAQIIASWFIAPLIAGAFASITFLVSKYGVLEVTPIQRSIKNGLLLVPVLVFITFSVLTMLITWKGSPNLKLGNLPGHTIIASIFGVGAVATFLYILFVYPFCRRKVLHGDWTLKWYDVFRGPIYFFKPLDFPPMPEGHQLTIDYYKGRRYEDDETVASASDVEAKISDNAESDVKEGSVHHEINHVAASVVTEEKPQTTRQLWWSLLKQGPKKWPHLLWLMFIHGFDQDVISQQVNQGGLLAPNLKGMHTSSKFYDNRLEFLYSLLQGITAGTMSFAHGANDISNATGPLAAVYLVWSSNTTGAKADVPVWVLCYAAAALVIGCWTYGYHIIRNLGNKLILQSPCRGFSIELGAAVTTVMATQLAIPVSTTQCAVGATVFVGLCNKDVKSVNWRMVLWCYSGWIFTLPVAGLIAGILNGIILNAPSYGISYSLTN